MSMTTPSDTVEIHGQDSDGMAVVYEVTRKGATLSDRLNKSVAASPGTRFTRKTKP